MMQEAWWKYRNMYDYEVSEKKNSFFYKKDSSIDQNIFAY